MALQNFPKQRLSLKEKIKDDRKWAKDVIDQLILHYASSSNSMKDEYQEKLSNYQLYNNILNQKDFERECNPLGIEVGQFKDEIQPYNKTYNKLQVLLGEELKRPFNYRTVLVNQDGVRAKELHKQVMLKEFLTQQINKHIAQYTNLPDLEQTQSTVIPPEELDEYFSTKYQDARERTADQILQYLYLKETIKEKKNDGFKHGLIAGEEIV